MKLDKCTPDQLDSHLLYFPVLLLILTKNHQQLQKLRQNASTNQPEELFCCSVTGQCAATMADKITWHSLYFKIAFICCDTDTWLLHCVSKNRTPVMCLNNTDKSNRILMIFGTKNCHLIFSYWYWSFFWAFILELWITGATGKTDRVCDL